MALPVVALAAAGIQAASSLAGGIAQGEAASYQSQVARNNAAIATQNQTYSAQAGAQATTEAALKARAEQGGVRTSLAANDLDVNTGSAAAVQIGQRTTGALDIANTANNAALTTYGYGAEATGYRAQSGLYGAEAKEAPIGGALSAAGSVLSAAPDLSDKFGWMDGGGANSVNGGIDSYVAQAPITNYALME